MYGSGSGNRLVAVENFPYRISTRAWSSAAGDASRCVEMSAALASVSLRVSREFVSAVPRAAAELSPDDVRNWAEFGRRLAMGSVETAVEFFADGARPLQDVPADSRRDVFEICRRQLVLSSSIALESFELIPTLACEINDDWLLSEILKLASEIAARSAKHSAEFLQRTSAVAAALAKFGENKRPAAEASLHLACHFADRTGGMTADLWLAMPSVLDGLEISAVRRLMETAGKFLEFGGSVTLHFIDSGSAVLKLTPEAFDEWHALARKMGSHGNAVLIAFLRASPAIFAKLVKATSSRRQQALSSSETIIKIVSLIAPIAERDPESALAAFRSSPTALDQVSIDQFEEWMTRRDGKVGRPVAQISPQLLCPGDARFE